MIDRETEATLAVTGCPPLLDPQATGAILFDIGGGSSEVIRLDRDPNDPRAAPKISAWISSPLGVVTLAERHGGTDVTPELYDAMVAEVASHSSRSRKPMAAISPTFTCSAPPAR